MAFWVWVFLAYTAGTVVGFFACAMFTVGKEADDDDRRRVKKNPV